MKKNQEIFDEAKRLNPTAFAARYGRSKAVKAIYVEAQRRKAYAESNNADYTNAEFRKKVEANLLDIACCLPSSGYSMGEVKVAKLAFNPHLRAFRPYLLKMFAV